jgi:hypothetical protein
MMPLTSNIRALRVLAWSNVALHGAGLGFASLGMRPGTPLAALPDRLAYLARFPLGWSLGWGVWMLCALALVGFCAVLAYHLREPADLVRLALMVVIAGGAFDLFCDAVFITVLPDVAARQPPLEDLFVTVERLTGVGSLIVANGLYSVGTLLFTLALRQRSDIGRAPVALGYGVFGSGMMLTAAGFTGVPWHAEWATGPTIGLFCAWALSIAYSLHPAGSRP